MDINNYIKKIFHINNESKFNDYALKLFHYQYKNNHIYNQYITLMNCKIDTIKHYSQIPFLPIEFFRTKKVISTKKTDQHIFLSSGTTSSLKSKHYITDLEIYKKSIRKSFELFFGNPKEYVFLCLVPSFSKNQHSSLAFMCNELINLSNQANSGFYLNEPRKLISTIQQCQKDNTKFILFGLSFELLQLANNYNIPLLDGLVIETGGTKNKQERIIKEDMHNRLKNLFQTENIISEYGMAELLSQSYYFNNNYFKSPPWKKILIRNKTNPLEIETKSHRGHINIIDLANIYSCGFIATNDTGHLTQSGFNITGRSQIASNRGCNLMI